MSGNIDYNLNLEENADFKGLYSYKLFLPIVMAAYYIVIFAAPFAPSYVYHILYITLAFNTVNMVFLVIRMTSATRQVVKNALLEKHCDEESLIGIASNFRYQHVFVIPNYNEPMAALRKTIKNLADHPASKKYIIVLAMEAKEANFVEKAETLMKEFQQEFQVITYTTHTLVSGEMPGKGSNVNAAVRQISDSPWVCKDMMVTILDADALVHQRYVLELDQKANSDDVFAAPVLFEQNCSTSPLIVCVKDFMWAAMSMQSASSWTGVGFPISTYSISLALAKRVGFWDTQPDAIGEDMHMMIKSMVKTGGVSRVQPIYVPMNMAHVEGKNYFSSVWARVLQAERHMRGMADTGYVLKHVPTMLRIGKYNSRAFSTAILLVLSVLEAHLLPFVAISTMVVVVPYYEFLKSIHVISPAAFPYEIDMLSKVCLMLAITILTSYEVMRYFCCKYLYKRAPNFKWYWMWGYILLLVAAFPFSVLPAAYVAMNHALNRTNTTYFVAPKK